MSTTSTRRPTIDDGSRRRLAAVRPLERAQLVWQRALELVDPTEQHDRFALALDLLRTAHHDPATVSHALALGRTHLRSHADDARARSGAGILESAIEFLGVRPRRDDVTRARR
jgi:hypothetical protein